ncbi:unnamed protein product [Prorocentrum cordatum]|uniref:Uncharacterized protein n=1 Tax=Prorocentrum cordatum TaxID=2364126 RepID=A0ABN9WA82_9DINO|nr:unnamed protein product [Polarella glacialis]
MRREQEMQRALGKVELQLAHVYLVGLRHSSRPPLRHSDAVRTSQRNEEARGEKTRSTTKKEEGGEERSRRGDRAEPRSVPGIPLRCARRTVASHRRSLRINSVVHALP